MPSSGSKFTVRARGQFQAATSKARRGPRHGSLHHKNQSLSFVILRRAITRVTCLIPNYHSSSPYFWLSRIEVKSRIPFDLPLNHALHTSDLDRPCSMVHPNRTVMVKELNYSSPKVNHLAVAVKRLLSTCQIILTGVLQAQGRPNQHQAGQILRFHLCIITWIVTGYTKLDRFTPIRGSSGRGQITNR